MIKRKSVRWISVSRLIRMLVKEGYEAADFNARCQNFAVALQLAEKLGAHRKTLNFIILDFVARAKRMELKFNFLKFPGPEVMLKFAQLGASRSAIESLVKEFARNGIMGGNLAALIAASKILGRKPKQSEILMIVDDYIKSSFSDIALEKRLITLAGDISCNLVDQVRNKLSERHSRLSHHSIDSIDW